MKEEKIQEIRLSAPGNGFADSFLLGNGAFGAALGMDPLREEVRLSHGCFFSGAPRWPPRPARGPGSLPEGPGPLPGGPT